MVVYEKRISSMQAYKEIDGSQNVVFAINWTLVGRDGSVEAACPATTTVPYIAGSSFTPFDQLTEAQVLQWIEEYTPVAYMQGYKNTIDFTIAQQTQQEIPPLPWVSPPTPPAPPPEPPATENTEQPVELPQEQQQP